MELAVYFNLDLTLTQMRVPFSEITTQVFEDVGVPPDMRDGAAYAGLFFEELAEGGPSPWQRAFARYFEERGLSLDAEHAATLYVDRELASVQPAFAGLVPFLDELARRFPVGVLTRGIGHVQRAKLDKLGISELLADIVISHETGANKADGSLFRVAETRSGADSFVYVSTHRSDIRSADDAGWQTIFAEHEEIERSVTDWLAELC